MSERRENWRWVPGYEHLYMVSDYGNVMSVNPRKGSQPFKPLRLSSCGSGYQKVVLRKDGQSSNVMIHRIVASAFLPNPEHKDEVNHKDGDKSNNSVSNLEWVTRSENQRHSVDILGNRHVGTEHPVKINAEIARRIYRAEGSYSSIAREYGIIDTMVRNIKTGKSWKRATCHLTL